VTIATRTARGDPGEMLVLLSALRKYLASKMFSTFNCRCVAEIEHVEDIHNVLREGGNLRLVIKPGV
jgi:hypothetical protein